MARDTHPTLRASRIALAAALVLLAAGAGSLRPAASAEAGHAPSHFHKSSDRLLVAREYPAPPLYELLPHDYPYPLIRTCYTYAGICLIPYTIRPGAPCYCEASNGVRVEGVCTK